VLRSFRDCPVFSLPVAALLTAVLTGTVSPQVAGDDPLPAGAVLRLGSVRPPKGQKVYAVALSPDGKVIASGHGDGTVRLWEAATGNLLRRLEEHKASVDSLAWLPDGRELLSADGAGLAVRWDAQARRKPRTFRFSAGSGPLLALAPDGRTVATGGYRAHLLDPVTGQPLRKLQEWEFARLLCPLFSPDSKVLVGSVERSEQRWALSAWNVATGKLLRRFPWPAQPGLDDLILALAFTPDGRSVISGSENGTVRLWEATTGSQQIAYWTHAGPITTLAVSPDGRHIASGGEDKLVRVRDLVSGWEVLRLRGHRDRITAVAFTPDGQRVVSASLDGTVLVWRGPERAAEEPPAELSAAELDAAWRELAGKDATAAYRASRRMLTARGASLAMLRQRLRPVPPLEAGLVERLIADLDSPRFATRERAAREIEKVGRLAEPALRRALAKDPNEELRRRVTVLLERVAPEAMSPDELQPWRALAVVEYAGTPEARRLLGELSQGAPGARLTTWASATLARLSRHNPSQKMK